MRVDTYISVEGFTININHQRTKQIIGFVNFQKKKETSWNGKNNEANNTIFRRGGNNFTKTTKEE